ncbi:MULTISPECIES: hypothetical protein [Clostridium]|uniref:hypothetical protein n=2 Tax=Clostridiaceae TaxID=31979 RepID=UPI00242F4711|nr:hypothetical protein [Clostridium tyrobutyricum]
MDQLTENIVDEFNKKITIVCKLQKKLYEKHIELYNALQTLDSTYEAYYKLNKYESAQKVLGNELKAHSSEQLNNINNFEQECELIEQTIDCLGEDISNIEELFKAVLQPEESIN